MFPLLPISRREALACAVASSAGLALAEVKKDWRLDSLFDLRDRVDRPVALKKLELLRHTGRSGPHKFQDQLFIRAISDQGVGIAPAIKGRVLDIQSLLARRVAPLLLGQNLRWLPQIIDDIYLQNSNYKYVGMPFWNAVAHAELACLDLLARLAETSVGGLLRKVLRTEIPVYISRFDRHTTAAYEVRTAKEVLERRGAKAVKLKVGLRMKTSIDQDQRDIKMVELARKDLGDDIQINVDANGSYTAQRATNMGLFYEKHGVEFMEEPCPWEDYDATRQVAEALDELVVAGGEQDSSWTRWQGVIGNGTFDLVQPDIFYNGGMLRTLRVARLAADAGLAVTPHSPKTGVEAFANLQLVSIIPNLGPFQEYRDAPEVKDGKVAVPKGPGLGVEYDPADWKKAEVLWAAEANK